MQKNVPPLIAHLMPWECHRCQSLAAQRKVLCQLGSVVDTLQLQSVSGHVHTHPDLLQKAFLLSRNVKIRVHTRTVFKNITAHPKRYDIRNLQFNNDVRYSITIFDIRTSIKETDKLNVLAWSSKKRSHALICSNLRWRHRFRKAPFSIVHTTTGKQLF